MTIAELRGTLAEKHSRDVEQVRVTTMLASLPRTPAEAFPAEVEALKRDLTRAVKHDLKDTLETEVITDLKRDLKSSRRRRERALEDAGHFQLLESLAEFVGDDPETYATTTGLVDVAGLFVGTAEAAAMLGVERPRIGKWRALGRMPEPVAELCAGPVWLRSQVEALREGTEQRRKPRRPAEAAA